MKNDTSKPIVDSNQDRIIQLILSMSPANRKLFVESIEKIAGVVHCEGIPPTAEKVEEINGGVA